MTEASVSFAGNLTDDPELRYTEGGIARAMFRVAVSGRREQEPSFFTLIVWRDQAEHAAQSLSKGSRVVVVGRLQQRSWTAEDGSARQVVEVVAEELGPNLTSGSSALSCWVEVPELDAGVLGREPPVDPTTGPVARRLPGRDLPLQGRPVGQAPIQALPSQHGQLDLGHVQPAAMPGRVVQLQLVGEPLGLGRWERLVQRRGVWVLRLSWTSTIRTASG
jgi:single-stranded DNA-binding protein